MKLIQKVIEKASLAETVSAGAVGGGAVAGYAMPLFAQLTTRELPKKIRIARQKKQKKVKSNGLGLKETFYSLSEDGQEASATFDTSEVISKLKSLENKGVVNKYETQAFALEDEDGNIVKVRVRIEQAPSFEASLNAFLSDVEEDTDGKRGMPEIAEILFKLKDRYDIVDVEWPDVPEDQEEGGVTLGGEQQPGMEGQPGAEGELDVGDPNQLDLGAGEAGMGGGEEDVKGLLTQVIDMMKADAEARKAEAHARAAEAKAKEADLATKQVYAKVKQEEQILDMESQDKQHKEADKEAKRLAKLARWKHDMEQDEGASFDDAEPELDIGSIARGREEEESPRGATYKRPAATQAQPANKTPRLSGRVRPTDVASYILSRVK
jgi:hypothetical protein